MSNQVIIKLKSKFDLDKKRVDLILTKLSKTLKNRVLAAYIFGSIATNTYNKDSDIDLILIKETNENFITRSFEFIDILNIHPEIDILVYTKEEFEKGLSLDIPFWKNIKNNNIKLI